MIVDSIRRNVNLNISQLANEIELFRTANCTEAMKDLTIRLFACLKFRQQDYLSLTIFVKFVF